MVVSANSSKKTPSVPWIRCQSNVPAMQENKNGWMYENLKLIYLGERVRFTPYIGLTQFLNGGTNSLPNKAYISAKTPIDSFLMAKCPFSIEWHTHTWMAQVVSIVNTTLCQRFVQQQMTWAWFSYLVCGVLAPGQLLPCPKMTTGDPLPKYLLCSPVQSYQVLEGSCGWPYMAKLYYTDTIIHIQLACCRCTMPKYYSVYFIFRR